MRLHPGLLAAATRFPSIHCTGTSRLRFNSTIPIPQQPEQSPQKTEETILKAEAIKEKDEQSDIESTTGEIDRKAREGIFYFDNVYPVVPGRFSFTSYFLSTALGLTENRVSKIIQKHAFPPDFPVKLTQLIPRYKDGGAFGKFEISADAPNVSQEDAEACIYSYLKDHDYRPIFNPFRRMRVFGVKGVPWIEDLKRANSTKVRVVFNGDDLSQESLYKVLRRYGTIIDIESPPPGAKDLPRSAVVQFSVLRDACTARNCVNSLTVKNTKIHIAYIPSEKAGTFKKAIFDHPRISIPVILALLATLAVLIFEPIRTWFIKKKVCGSHGLEKYRLYRYLVRLKRDTMSTLNRYLHFSASAQSRFEDLWTARQESVGTLKQWIEENVNTFIVVNGPRGSGKNELVSKIALSDRKNVITIDCESLSKARSDTLFVKTASNQLGYYPVFPWMKNLTTFVDLIVQGLTGQKTGLSESNETQFKAMLNTTATALKEVALENFDRNDSEIKLTEESYLQLHSEVKPVVVIKHFLNEVASADTKDFIYKQLADFASVLVQTNTAHVIFVSNDTSFDKTLSVSLPNQLFKILTIGDADPQSAKNFVMQQIIEANKTTEIFEEGTNEKVILAEPKLSDFPNLEEALRPLGGRMTDLQTFARRIMSGEPPMMASKDLVRQSASEILQMFLLKANPGWTREQVWVIIKMLAELEKSNDKSASESSGGWFRGGSDKKHKNYAEPRTALPTLPFSDLVCTPSFKTIQQQEALVALQHSEMIALIMDNGRPSAIKAGKPLYQAAFRALVADPELKAMMETQLMEKLIATENGKITKLEEELLSLSKLPKRWEINERIDYLSTKLSISQGKIMDYEDKIAIHADFVKELKKKQAATK
ncbi:hypothetical protein D0Z00_001273 [Geotrichum galactomycetum]|uniref:Uncharacterized protein n=1 Tax=Geotrichum galactomycetum TaxID=27317 RepID=A0ACB6V7U3_9ASCO|nr:hypothetical protein D0Z00_001273 [Geotrichum candidum]